MMVILLKRGKTINKHSCAKIIITLFQMQLILVHIFHSYLLFCQYMR